MDEFEITSPDKAMEMAEENLTLLVRPIIVQVEDRIKAWLGPPGKVTVTLWGRNAQPDPRALAVVKEMYETKGWIVTTYQANNTTTVTLQYPGANSSA